MQIAVGAESVVSPHAYAKVAPGLTRVEPGVHAIVQFVPAEIIPLLAGQSTEAMFSG